MSDEKIYRIALTLEEAELILSYIPNKTVSQLKARDKFYKVSQDLVKSGRYDITLHGITKRLY